MLNQNEKIERFAEVINKSAATRCKRLEKQTEKFRKSQLSLLEAQEKKELSARLSYEVQKIQTETNSTISALTAQSKQRIVAKRDEITAEVFALCEERLKSFVKSEEYKSFLQKSISNLLCEVGEDGFVYVRECDTELCKKMFEGKSVTFLKGEDIKIGGAYASNKEKSVFVSDTLEGRLSEKREAFMAFSGLSIE